MRHSAPSQPSSCTNLLDFVRTKDLRIANHYLTPRQPISRRARHFHAILCPLIHQAHFLLSSPFPFHGSPRERRRREPIRLFTIPIHGRTSRALRGKMPHLRKSFGLVSEVRLPAAHNKSIAGGPPAPPGRRLTPGSRRRGLRRFGRFGCGSLRRGCWSR